MNDTAKILTLHNKILKACKKDDLKSLRETRPVLEELLTSNPGKSISRMMITGFYFACVEGSFNVAKELLDNPFYNLQDDMNPILAKLKNTLQHDHSHIFKYCVEDWAPRVLTKEKLNSFRMQSFTMACCQLPHNKTDLLDHLCDKLIDRTSRPEEFIRYLDQGIKNAWVYGDSIKSIEFLIHKYQLTNEEPLIAKIFEYIATKNTKNNIPREETLAHLHSLMKVNLEKALFSDKIDIREKSELKNINRSKI